MLLLSLLACDGPVATPPDSVADSDSDAVHDTAPVVDPAFELGAVQHCTDPAPLTWTDVGGALEPGPNLNAEHVDGGGVALVDANDDGRLDALVSWADATDLFLQTDTGWSRAWRIELGGGLAYDGSDLWLANPDGLHRVALSDGEVLQSLASRDGTSLARSPAIADLNGDGRLDLYLPRTAPESRDDWVRDTVVWGGSEGPWEQVDAVPGGLGRAFGAAILDWDQDGRPDVYVDNDMGRQHGGNELFAGGAQLTDRSDDCACDLEHSGMGVDAADVNRDGLVDLVLAGTDKNVLLLGSAPGLFVDSTAAWQANPVPQGSMSWGAVAADLDNDGRLDMISALGDLWAAGHGGEVFESGIAVLAQGETAFTPVDWLGDATGSWRGIATGDVNGDGVLDVLVGDVVDRPVLLVSQGCTEAGWLQVQAPLGAQVEVETPDGVQTAWVNRESAYASADAGVVHVGLGSHQQVLSVRVTLLRDQGAYSIQGPLPARRTLVVTAPE
jgi:hypothetical protein